MPNNQNNNTRNLIIMLVVAVVLGGLVVSYFIFEPDFGGGLLESSLTPVSETSAPTPDSYSSQVGRELIERLQELERINLNTDFVESDAFARFEDLSRELEEEPLQRTNPFAPIQ